MEKYAGIVARVFLSSLYFVSIILILQFIIATPNGYEIYQADLMSKGLYGFFAPVNIFIQLIFGIFLIVGYKIKLTSYVFAIFSILWVFTYFRILGALPSLETLPDNIAPEVYQDIFYKMKDLPIKILLYLSLSGGFLYMAANHKMVLSIDNLLEKRSQRK